MEEDITVFLSLFSSEHEIFGFIFIHVFIWVIKIKGKDG